MQIHWDRSISKGNPRWQPKLFEKVAQALALDFEQVRPNVEGFFLTLEFPRCSRGMLMNEMIQGQVGRCCQVLEVQEAEEEMVLSLQPVWQP